MDRHVLLNNVGIALAVVGTLLALVSYSGDRVYDLAFLTVAIVGGAMILVGVGILAVLRASADKAGRRADSLRTSPKLEAPTDGRTYRVVLQCPSCGGVFSEVGLRPLSARCPDCGASGSSR